MRRTQVTLLLATMLGLTVLVVAPVAAETTTTTTTDEHATISTEPAQPTDENKEPMPPEPSGSVTTSESGTVSVNADEETHVKAELAQDHDRALQELQTERKNAKEHTAAERQQACQAHQAELDTRIANYAKEAQDHLNVFAGIYTKVQTFYTTQHLSVSNYTTLAAAVTTQQTAAQQAVDALNQLSGTKLDCTQPDPAQTVAVVKAAVVNARNTLQAYRQAIRTLVVALEGASSAHTETQTTTTGGNQ